MTDCALRNRLSEFYGVTPAELLPVRGALHAAEIVIRHLARRGGLEIAAPYSQEIERLASIYGVRCVDAPTAATAAIFSSFDDRQSAPFDTLKIIDESEIEFSDLKSSIGAGDNVVVIRSLEEICALQGAPCGALIGSPRLIEQLPEVIEPGAIPAIIERAALSALDPARLAIMKTRIANIRRERKRLADGLARSPSFRSVRELEVGAVLVEPNNASEFLTLVRQWKINAHSVPGGRYKLRAGSSSQTENTLLAFGAVDRTSGGRVGEVVRETAETRIAAIVDLDREGAIEIETGVGFFDHMLTQIAHHAGISLTLVCRGDLEIDAHHTVEDCAIAFGQALSLALAERRGIARFGFVLPMDEAEAKISIDLGGRPYLVFDGEFAAPSIGEYPTEMTEHAFRSISQSLGASIHLSVKGENDHHKTEACYKAFGRALRQALRVEGDVTPSTKGVL